MKALSLRQPWGWAVAHAGKRLENRTDWPWLAKGMGSTPRERIAIHCSKSKPTYGDVKGVMVATGVYDAPLTVSLPVEAYTGGCIVATCRIIEVIRFDPSEPQPPALEGEWPRHPLRRGDRDRLIELLGEAEARDQIQRWWLGRYALVLADVVPFTPITGVAGALSFWRMPPHVVDQIPVEAR